MEAAGGEEGGELADEICAGGGDGGGAEETAQEEARHLGGSPMDCFEGFWEGFEVVAACFSASAPSKNLWQRQRLGLGGSVRSWQNERWYLNVCLPRSFQPENYGEGADYPHH